MALVMHRLRFPIVEIRDRIAEVLTGRLAEEFKPFRRCSGHQSPELSVVCGLGFPVVHVVDRPPDLICS